MASNVQATVTTITPEAAQKLLKDNVSNRPLSNNRVQRLCRAITDGRWVLNGASIVVDSKQRLVDGQHRLHAVVRSGKSIRTVLVTGVTPKAFDTIDQGARRSGADIFSICGVRNPGVVSASIGVVWQNEQGIAEGSTGRYLPDQDQRVALFDELPDYEEVVAEACHYRKGMTKVYPFSALVGLYYLWHRCDAEAAIEFLKILASGQADAGHPARVAREKFIELATNDYRISRQSQCAYLKIAWNHFAAGTGIEELLLPKHLEIPVNKVTNRFWLTKKVA